MKLVKKLHKVFNLVPIKKIKIISFFFSSILGYIILAFFPYITSQIIKYATSGSIEEAYKYTLILGITYIIYESVWFLNYYIYSKLQTYYSDSIHRSIFKKIATSSRDFNNKVDKGKMLSLISEDVPGFCLLIDYAINYISAIFMFVLVLILTLKAHFLFAIIILISSVLYIVYINKNTERFTAHLKEQKKHNDAINNLYLEELNGLKEIKTLDIKDKLQRKLTTKLKRYNKAYFKKRKYHQRNENTSTLFPHYTKFILYLILLVFMIKMNATIELVILIIGYYDQIVDALDEMLVSYKEMETYYVSVERVSDILTYEDKIDQLFGDYEGDQVYGSIVFKDVCYKYDSRYILDHVNFEVKPNTLTVVVGESGSGKTTLFELLARFYNLHGGTIYLDGRDIYEYSNSIYASNITLVKQNPFLYNMSIDHNLRLVNSSKKRRIEACKEVGIHEFIMSLKTGYRTILTQNAQNLSGGQKQLLSIARALLTDAEILLMDDITSSLDPKTTDQIIELLKKLKEDHTILITTNREDLIAIADQILYIKNATIKSYKTLEEFKTKTGYESRVN